MKSNMPKLKYNFVRKLCLFNGKFSLFTRSNLALGLKKEVLQIFTPREIPKTIKTVKSQVCKEK